MLSQISNFFSLFYHSHYSPAQRKKRRYFSLAVLLLCSFPAIAQFHQFRNYNVRDGLPSSEVYAMTQDASGYLWFTTDMGVSRFDGYEFRNFNTGNGMPDNTIFGVRQDARGRVWFLSFSGKLSYYLNERICTLPCNTKLGAICQGTFMTSLYVDEGDTIWAGTTKNRLIKIFPGWKESDVHEISLREKEGYLCLVGKQGFVYGGGSKAVTNMSVYTSSMQKRYTLQLYPSHSGYAGIRYSVNRLANGNFLVTSNTLAACCNENGVLSSVTMSSIGICTYEDTDGSIMAGTYTGVNCWSGADFTNETQLAEFRQKVVTAIFRDRENGLWFCTEGNGIFCIAQRNFLYYTPQNGLPESKISSVAVIAGAVLTGHLDGSLSILNDTSVSTIAQSSFPGGNNRITSFTGINDHVALVSCVNQLFSIDIKTKKANFFATQGCKKIIRSADGNYWALRFRFIGKHDPVHFQVLKEIPFNLFADNIYEDHTGKLWICAINGLWTYDGQDGLLYLGKDNPLLASRIVDLREDADGNIWMVSRGNGLIVKSGSSYFQILRQDGLAGNMCRCIMLDADHVAWIGTNNGLSRIAYSTANGFHYSISSFSSKNGLLTNEVNEILRVKEKIWAFHTNGISIFDPAKLQSNSFPPPVYITSTLVNGDTFPAGTNRFPHDQNYFTISFTGLSYKDPGHLTYRYKMEGVDSAWVYTSYTSVNYQTLPPGQYRFLVAAQNNDGFWSAAPATISFEIEPAWWQTWLFRIGISVILLMLVALLFKYRLDKIRRRERKKTEFNNRIATYELNALRAQMNPHFVFNAINSVQYFITMNDPESSQKYLSKFAKLIRYVVDNSRLSSITIEKEIEALQLYLDFEGLRFGNRFEYSIMTHPNVDTQYTQIPSMLIQPYVENSIWHGIMHKQGNGRIDIRLEMKGLVLQCTVQDNGIGRKKSMALKNENGYETHRSVGMSNTKERLDILNQVNNSRMNVFIEDLYGENGEPTGTKVEIHIPVIPV